MAEISSVFGSIDWGLYVTTVLQTLREACKQYSDLKSESPSEKVYQISIWTDPQAQITAISFETMGHAKRLFLHEAGLRTQEELQTAAEEWHPFDLQTAPPAFKYNEFRTVHHPELSALATLNYPEDEEEVLNQIEASLLRVVKQIQEENLLAGLHAEEEIWIGINSAEDWYDDDVKIPVGGPNI